MQNQSINPRIAGLSPYKPGKPVDEVARERLNCPATRMAVALR